MDRHIAVASVTMTGHSTTKYLSALTLLVCAGSSPLMAQDRPTTEPPALSEFAKQIIVPDLYESKREATLQPKPEVFIQTRFSRGRINDAPPENATQNFELTRLETG
jgi:hypothetical protein